MSVAEALALSTAQQNNPQQALRAALKQADHTMLAGDYRGAASAFASLAAEHPGQWLPWAKLVRLAIFASIPAVREACFREAYSR